jgi:hypothetical protein
MERLKSWAPDIILLCLYMAICAAIVLRVSVETTGYTSPDSEFYLELAQNLKDGRGFYMSNEYPIPAVKTPENQVYFSAWPVGYPVLVFLVSEASRLDVFWASKVVNLLLLGLGLLLLRQVNRPYAFIPGSVYCAFTMLEIHSYTWSEAAFMSGLLCFVYLMTNILKGENINQNILLLLFACMYLFLIRYIGAFAIGLVALAAVYLWHQKRMGTAKKLLLVFLSLCLFEGLYFGMNYLQTGSFSGGDRLARETEHPGQLALLFTQGIVNELLLIRHYNFKAAPDTLLIFTIILQVTVVYFVLRALKACKDTREALKKNLFSQLCLITAGFYLLSLAILRSLSPFDFDFRLLSPFTYLLLIGLVHYVVVLPDSDKKIYRAKWLIFFFFLLSLLLNLPKQYLLQRLLG